MIMCFRAIILCVLVFAVVEAVHATTTVVKSTRDGFPYASVVGVVVDDGQIFMYCTNNCAASANVAPNSPNY